MHRARRLRMPLRAPLPKSSALHQAVGRHSGAYVFDITANKRIRIEERGVKRILASNTKLFTAAAALDRYGADGRFTTRCGPKARLPAASLTGDLYLRGGGDPLFGSNDFVKKNFGSNATVEALALEPALHRHHRSHRPGLRRRDGV